MARVLEEWGPACCRPGRELCLASGNLRASFHPTWLSCVSGWYGELGARSGVYILDIPLASYL